MFNIKTREMELIEKIEDDKVLFKAFYQEEDIDFRSIILKKIKNMDLIDEVAQDSKFESRLRTIAISRCSKNVIKKIVEDYSENEYIRKYAIKIFKDEDYNWYQLFKNEKSKMIQNVIVEEKINNPYELVKIAMESSDNLIIKNVLEKVSDEKSLLEVFRYEGLIAFKEKVLKKLHSEESILSAVNRIEVSEASSGLLDLILKKLVHLKREDIISQLLLKLEDKQMIENYIVYVTDKNLLLKVSKEANFWYTNAVAKDKLDKINDEIF